MAIKPESPIIDSAVLDLIGREFKFDHAKGISELLKNSIDAYNLEGNSDPDQEVYILLDLASNNRVKLIQVLDFVGMTKEKIDAAFKRWFDPTAAKTVNLSEKKDIKTLGGHGNGGKFYMREMFVTSELVSYRNGYINCFGFDKSKNYGFDQNLNDRKVDLSEAIKLSGLEKYCNLFDKVLRAINKFNRFTVIRCQNPKNSHKTNTLSELINKLVAHPQAKRIIQFKNVYLITNNSNKITRLSIPELKPKKGFESFREFVCPEFVFNEDEKIKIQNHHNIKLKLFTSDEPLKGMKHKGRNSIDFLGDIGVIANYDISKIGHFQAFGYSEFIYGECECPIMEVEDLVTNDRQNFIEAPLTQAILNWVKGCVEKLCLEMDAQVKKEKKIKNLHKTSQLNELLNRWKNRFLEKMFRERLAGTGDSFGIEGQNEESWTPTGKSSKSKKNNERPAGNKGGSKKRNSASFPMVKISGIDPDPFGIDDTPFECDKRQPAVYQRPIDFQNGIYWINTSKMIANKILDKYGPDSSNWRDYLFQRYLDIIIKESIFFLSKSDSDFNSDTVLNEFDRITSDVLDMAAQDLDAFLFDSDYNF